MADSQAPRRQRTKSVARAAAREARRPMPDMSATTADSFQNFTSRIGYGTDNQSSDGTYGFSPISRLRIILDYGYRSSWVMRAAVQAIPKDMTREGIELGSGISPEDADVLQRDLNYRYGIWHRLREAMQWGRLYGGAGAYIMIDGHRSDTPLDLARVGKGQFNGLLVLDRWMLNPSLTDLVTDQSSPDFGRPKFYTTLGDTPLPPSTKIHHSRFLRFEGDDLPYYQRLSENLWSMSVLEPIWDRLLAFDSTTAGTAQLVHRASLRHLSIEGFREIIAAGGKRLEAMLAQVDWMRRYQTNEGITLLDALDKFETFQYSFTGLDAVLIQMAQQMSGSLRIPLVILFGQSPAGFSTGDTDVRNYYDSIKSDQERDLSWRVFLVLQILAANRGIKLPSNFAFTFRPLWQLTDEQKSAHAQTTEAAVGSAFERGVIGRKTALQELRQQSRVSGMFTNITDEMIDAADEEPPAPSMLGEGEGEGGPKPHVDEPPRPGAEPDSGEGEGEGADDFLPGSRRRAEADQGAFEQSELETTERRRHKPLVHIHFPRYADPGDVLRTVHEMASFADADHPARPLKFAGLDVMVERETGEARYEGSSGGAVMSVPYGYFPGTRGNDGDSVDVFLGPNEASNAVFVIDQRDPDTKKFHQHKCFLGFGKSSDVLKAFDAFYADGRSRERVARGREMTLPDFKNWLSRFREEAAA